MPLTVTRLPISPRARRFLPSAAAFFCCFPAPPKSASPIREASSLRKRTRFVKEILFIQIKKVIQETVSKIKPNPHFVRL